MAYHCSLTGDDIHVLNTWTYATSAERLAATGFTADDVHKVAVQENDHSIWVLVDHSPITWQLVGGVPEHTRLHEMTNVLDHEAGNYKVFYSDGSGNVKELSLGTVNFVLKSAGPSAAPAFGQVAHSEVTGVTANQHHNRLHTMVGTSDHQANNWRLFYSNGSGQVQELALGASGTYLKSQGASATPTWDTPAASSSIFGDEYQQTTSEGESSTTSATYQQKLRMTTTDLSGGTYMIQYSWEFDGDNNHGWSRAQLNDTTDLNEDRYDSSQISYIMISGFSIQALSGVNTIDIDFRANSGGDTMLIRRARIALWRVS